MRCVVLDDWQDAARTYADWSVLPDLDLVGVRGHLDDDRVVAALAGAEVVVVMRERTPLTRELLERLPDLRLVVTSGMRNASIDLTACAERGIVVCGTASSATAPTELTWALIHGLTRQLLPEAEGLRRGSDRWQVSVGTDLAGSRLGLVGLGKIGARVARIAQAFEMDVVAWSPHLTDERAAAAGARMVPQAELFSTSDVVSLHLVLAEATREIVGAEELGMMRRSAYLVNTSRAGLVDSSALLDALSSGGIAGAGLDVFDEEPLPGDHPLRTHPHVLATPHLGYVTQGNYRTYFTEAVEDIAAWLAGEPVRVLG